MPYISENMRGKFDLYLDAIYTIDTKGELEYCIFKLMKKYMKHKEFKYTELHNCVYASMHCADEFRRRFLDEREDEARDKNGDIK